MTVVLLILRLTLQFLFVPICLQVKQWGFIWLTLFPLLRNFPEKKNVLKGNTFILEQPKQDGHQFLSERRLEGAEKNDPALMRLQFAKYVKAGIFDIFYSIFNNKVHQIQMWSNLKLTQPKGTQHSSDWKQGNKKYRYNILCISQYIHPTCWVDAIDWFMYRRRRPRCPGEKSLTHTNCPPSSTLQSATGRFGAQFQQLWASWSFCGTHPRLGPSLADRVCPAQPKTVLRCVGFRFRSGFAQTRWCAVCPGTWCWCSARGSLSCWCCRRSGTSTLRRRLLSRSPQAPARCNN